MISTPSSSTTGATSSCIAVSVDPDTALASWARDLEFALLFGSDVGQAVGKLYGSVRGASTTARSSSSTRPDAS